MRYITHILALVLVLSAWTPAFAQKKSKIRRASKTDSRKQFTLDVLRMAVALPQPDSQDRLRVLNSAIGVAAPMAPKTARTLAQEGARLEAELIASGQKPTVSILSSGYVDCRTATEFVERLPASAVQQAEESLLGALSSCPKSVFEPARLKVQTALDSGVLAARALLALMEQAGVASAWSQTHFEKMFSALPSDAKEARQEAPNFAAMFVRMAPEVEKRTARSAGLKFLEWQARVEESGERNLAVNLTTEALRNALGEQEYEEALRSSVIAQGVASTAGQPAEIAHEEYESVSVLEAMNNTGTDRTEQLAGLTPSLRAREAAAHGFATGTNGDRKMAERYFDIAFAAVNEVWSNRSPEADAPAVVEEVSEAAAHVDAVAALGRAQKLDDPTAQAISMLAVARVVVGSE